MPRLSICIPTYCQIDFLREALLSIQAQDFNDYELIISDDSPDDTVARLVASFNFDGRLRYHRNPVSLGSPENWNEAVRRATGDYIKVLHHDDRLNHPGALSAFVRLLDEHPEANFAFCASRIEDVISIESRIHRLTDDQLAKLSDSPEKLFFGNVIGAPSATIYRNGLGIEYDRRMKWLVDIDFYIRVLQQNHRFVYTPEVLIVTPTNAVHQVTEICKDSAAIEFLEHLLLYQKIVHRLLNDQNARHAWFRLFEKYRIYSEKDLERLDIKLPSSNSMLAPFFRIYRREWLKRTPYRFYARLPETYKRVIRSLR
jgi:glycosyltransferase involved in cell wall biosynthesis